MYTPDEYKKLTRKYGHFASWAIWDYKDEGNTSIITQKFNELHSKFVLLGLNISGPLPREPWLNFHGGSIHDRKLKFACNDTLLRGAYMTDIFKGFEEVQAAMLSRSLTEDIIRSNVNQFNEEMRDIKIGEDSKFIIFGSHAAKYFNRYFRYGYKNEIVYYCHYSYYGISDRKWVEELWNKLGTHDNFDNMINKYRRS